MEYKKLPDLKGLATLRAVVELGGVEQAARALHIGQPAVTKRLRALDDSYGLPLMQRKGRKLGLTEAGEKVYAFSRLTLDHQKSLTEDLRRLRQGRDRLRLEVTFAIGERLLPDLLLAFADSHPEYHIDSRMGYSRRIQTRVATGLADLALLELAPDHSDILVQKWLDDELVLVCAPQHPLAQRNQIGVDELTRYQYVLREAESSTRITLDRELRDVGIAQLPTALEVGSTDTIVEIVGRGRYLSFLPRFAVIDALRQGQLTQLAVRGLPLKITLWIARNRTSIDNPVAEAFITLLRHYHSQETP